MNSSEYNDTINAKLKPAVFKFNFRARILPVVMAAAIALLGLSPVALAGETEGKKLTILYTNDTHSHLLPFDMPKIGKNIGGIARRQVYIEKVRRENPACLLLDGGDIFQGTPFYTFFKGEPELKAFSLCGYDATTLGNHDLDDGLANLLTQLSHANFPMICANVFYKKDGKPVFPAFKIFRRGGISIAVIGCIGATAWNVIPAKYRGELFMANEEKITRRLASMLRRHVDLIVFLSHLGYDPDLEFAKNVEDVDVIVGGHTNVRLDKPTLVKNNSRNGAGGTIVLQNFMWGVFMGRLDLEFDDNGKVTAFKNELHPIDSKIKVKKSSAMSKMIFSYEKQIKSRTSEKIGHNNATMLYPDDQKHLTDLPLGSYVCDALREYAAADLSIINSGAVRDIIPLGDVTIGNAISVSPFDNSIVTCEMTGADIAAGLIFIAENYGKISGYQYGGLSYTLDSIQKTARDIMIGGKPVDPAKMYKVATISYLLEGNQNGNVLFRNSKNKVDTGYYVRDMLVDYIKAKKEIELPPQGRMKVIK